MSSCPKLRSGSISMSVAKILKEKTKKYPKTSCVLSYTATNILDAGHHRSRWTGSVKISWTLGGPWLCEESESVPQPRHDPVYPTERAPLPKGMPLAFHSALGARRGPCSEVEEQCLVEEQLEPRVQAIGLLFTQFSEKNCMFCQNKARAPPLGSQSTWFTHQQALHAFLTSSLHAWRNIRAGLAANTPVS